MTTLPKVDDWSLLDRASRGNESAWRKLSDMYRARLLGLAFLITRSRASAEDVAQEAFAKLLTHPPKRSRESLMPYLSTIAYRLALKEVMRQTRLTEMEGIVHVDGSPTPEAELLIQEKNSAVEKALSGLDYKLQIIIGLRYQGGMSYDDIARLLNIPLGTVKSRLFTAIRNCRKLIEIKEY